MDIDTSRLRALAEEVKAASWSRSLAVELDWASATKPAAILALLDRLEAAEADARRYRWLTYAGWIDDAIMEANGIKEGISETLDAAIDAALSASEGAKP